VPTPSLDKDGYLVQLADWNEAVAQQLAQNQGIELADEHLTLIHLVRAFYEKFEVAPAMRPLVKLVREQLGEDKGNSIYLLQLFPGSPAKSLAKIAGLPRPANCL
jgi:tRNA 2-thiouridine synthesizing protein E